MEDPKDLIIEKALIEDLYIVVEKYAPQYLECVEQLRHTGFLNKETVMELQETIGNISFKMGYDMRTGAYRKPEQEKIEYVASMLADYL